eukprot:6764592-Prymnesium_polylepis.1
MVEGSTHKRSAYEYEQALYALHGYSTDDKAVLSIYIGATNTASFVVVLRAATAGSCKVLDVLSFKEDSTGDYWGLERMEKFQDSYLEYLSKEGSFCNDQTLALYADIANLAFFARAGHPEHARCSTPASAVPDARPGRKDTL